MLVLMVDTKDSQDNPDMVHTVDTVVTVDSEPMVLNKWDTQYKEDSHNKVPSLVMGATVDMVVKVMPVLMEDLVDLVDTPDTEEDFRLKPLKFMPKKVKKPQQKNL